MKGSRKVYLLFFWLFSVSAMAQINTDRMMLMGRNALYYEDYVLSIRRFNMVISAKPYLSEPYFYRGLAKFYLEDYTGAEEDCGAIDRNPFLPDNYRLRGLCRINLKRFEEAVSDLTDYQYQMLLDGLEYAKGRLVTEEGVHRLRVRAEDAAGNDSVAEAVFTIDHTPPVLYMGRLKNGAIYEEKVKIEVWVDGEKEYLTDLTLNGERQKLSTESRMFQCEIMESGNYIMGVQAEDAAGNQGKKVIRFEIRPGKSIVQKIWKPIEDLFSGHGEETENKMDQWIWAEIFGAAGILILLWYGWRMKRTGKRRK